LRHASDTTPDQSEFMLKKEKTNANLDLPSLKDSKESPKNKREKRSKRYLLLFLTKQAEGILFGVCILSLGRFIELSISASSK
jgi:hypothetical protein